MKLKCVSLFIAFCVCVLLHAQQNDTLGWRVSGLAKVGFLVAHHTTMAHLPKEIISAYEIGFTRTLCSPGSWQEWYKKPVISINAYTSNLGNRSILGRAYGAYSSIAFPFARTRKHYLLGRIGAGLGYLTKTFDQTFNQKNVAIGSHINALIQLGLRGEITMGYSNKLMYQLDLTHFSNGAFKVPNLGLNMFFFGLGYQHYIASGDKKRLTDFKIDSTHRSKSWTMHMVGVFSHKEIYPSGRKGAPVYALSVSARRVAKRRAGVEFTFDLVSKQIMFQYKPYIEKTQLSILQMGLFCGYVMPLDHFQFVIGMGTYVRDRYNPDDYFYHRVGMRYFFDNGLSLNLVLKSHWAKADYAEYGLGYNFKLRKNKK